MKYKVVLSAALQIVATLPSSLPQRLLSRHFAGQIMPYAAADSTGSAAKIVAGKAVHPTPGLPLQFITALA